ncbi:hypothetical protein M8C21_020834 [Ambrosia artemisiifolia]|uniref:Uncharacterized protein n=1 Tax=Ambrosia artemisiifolia TaxID=4212 RepID=A0AAD5GE88_AMBAR|nr:hypothetical protein M8C21_020834 [Ambrosia artemisiifolia]
MVRGNENLHLDDEIAEVVISSLGLGDDYGSLSTNSNLFAFQNDFVCEDDVPMNATSFNGPSGTGNDRAMMRSSDSLRVVKVL